MRLMSLEEEVSLGLIVNGGISSSNRARRCQSSLFRSGHAGQGLVWPSLGRSTCSPKTRDSSYPPPPFSTSRPGLPPSFCPSPSCPSLKTSPRKTLRSSRAYNRSLRDPRLMLAGMSRKRGAGGR